MIRLTPRQAQVVELVSEGRDNREIAALLNISYRTVVAHRSATYIRLDVHNAVELTRYVLLRDRRLSAQ